jgi:hypothetical protein
MNNYNTVGGFKGVLVGYRRAGSGVTNYANIFCDVGQKGRAYGRSWKDNRKTQFKKAAVTFKGLAVAED